jgi:hypothetical protein
MKKKNKNKGGRPTKFRSEKACRIVLQIAEELNVQNFERYCSIFHIAVILGVHVDTLYEWQKQHAEFSEAIKRWETKRNAVAHEFKRWSDARWIFCMKNWTGMSDKQSIDMPQEFTIKIQRIITDRKPEE